MISFAAALLFGLAAGRGQCPGGVCQIRQTADVYEWRTFAADAGRSYLFRNGAEVGAWDHAGRYYRGYIPLAGWGLPQDCPPIPAPSAPSAVPARSTATSAGCICGPGCQCVAGMVNTCGCRSAAAPSAQTAPPARR